MASSSRSAIPDRESRKNICRTSSTRSTRPRAADSGWAWRSAALSSRRTAARSRRHRNLVAQRFSSHCRQHDMTKEGPIVFVVDDDASVRPALESLIRSVGLRVKSFASAHDFLGYERPDAPACLVLDVRLPGLSGLDLQKELAADGNEVPI